MTRLLRCGWPTVARVRGRWPESPFSSLQKLNEEADVTFVRRALSLDELRRLVVAARTRGVAKTNATSEARHAELRRIGHERGLVYQTAALLGLRGNELTACQESRFMLTRTERLR